VEFEMPGCDRNFAALALSVCGLLSAADTWAADIQISTRTAGSATTDEQALLADFRRPTGEGVSLNGGLQQPGAEFKVPFVKPGTYQVSCGIHPKMKLSVTVK
jgi:hypothetical protein